MCRDRIKKIRESVTNEHAAVMTGLEEHNAAMAMPGSTRDTLNVARQQYYDICQLAHNSGTIMRLRLRLCLCLNYAGVCV